MNAADYRIGSTIKYLTISNNVRTVLVTWKDENINSEGAAGFEAEELGSFDEVWGYDSDILEVVKF